MELTILGVILGGILSWVITNFYYNLQKDPLPLLKELHIKIDAIHKIEVVRNHKEFRRLLKELDSIIAKSFHQIIQLLLPLSIDLSGLHEIHLRGDKQKFESYLNEALPNLFDFSKKLKKIIEESEIIKKNIDSAINNDCNF